MNSSDYSASGTYNLFVWLSQSICQLVQWAEFVCRYTKMKIGMYILCKILTTINRGKSTHCGNLLNIYILQDINRTIQTLLLKRRTNKTLWSWMHCRIYLEKNTFQNCFSIFHWSQYFLYRCWPIYFLPFILCSNQIVNLHCCQCKYYLGTYDRKKCRLIQRSSTLGLSEQTFQFYSVSNTQCKHRRYATT